MPSITDLDTWRACSIPKVAERYLIGHKGCVMQGIERDCRTRCFVERRTATPCVQIWGDRAQVDLVMHRVDAIISQHCPSWRVGAERERFGPGWGPIEPEEGGRISREPFAFRKSEFWC